MSGMKVELHAHTHYSKGTKILYDGISSPEEMVRGAAAKGLHAIAITDHNTMEGASKAVKFAKKYDIHVIKGEEISTSDGHMLALGIEEVIPRGMGVLETIDEVHSQGGITISPHPFDVKGDGLKKKCIHCDAMEAFNGLSVDRIANFKSRRFAIKHNRPTTAGSDAHMVEMIGYATVAANVDNIESLLKAIKKGKVSINARNPPVKVILKYSVERLKLSQDHTFDYIEKNFMGPKKHISKKLLGLVNRSPGKIDYMFNGMAYFSLASVITYGAFRELVKTVGNR